MRNDTLETVILDFYGFERKITVNTQTGRLKVLMDCSLNLPYDTPVYWVFVKVHKGRYEFDHVEEVSHGKDT